MPHAALRRGFTIAPGPLEHALAEFATAAEGMVDRLWRRDTSLWSHDPQVAAKVANRLGWLDSPALMVSALARLTSLGEGVRKAGFQDVVLLGMGGLSLAPEVLRAILGIKDGWPRLHVLDSTDPAAIQAVATDPRRTLYILASKSGTTIEPNSLASYFIGALRAADVEQWTEHFIAITDEGTELAARGRAEDFRDVFINPSDIGGRYSAISFFGLVPAALMGQPVAALVDWSLAMIDAAKPSADAPDSAGVLANPAVALGVLMAAAAKNGRDKLTLVLPPSLEPFGLWVEQLVAESTGKQEVGIVPIAGETLGDPRVYGDDRLFVRLRRAGDDQEERWDRALTALGNVPVATFEIAEPAALGAEFVRWEIATAIAGALLGINPFDEPNVQQAKDATRQLLARYEDDGELPGSDADRTLPGGARLTLSTAARQALDGRPASDVFRLVKPGDYVALLAYLGPNPNLADVLHRFRMTVRDTTRTATMFGYGPRYLHSTGQLHKGGPNTGVFVLVAAPPDDDVDIPGARYSFGALEQAQALGDFASLEATGRRALHVELPSARPDVLREALEPLLDALR